MKKDFKKLKNLIKHSKEKLEPVACLIKKKKFFVSKKKLNVQKKRKTFILTV